jgi:hypothetical protein
MFDIKSDEWKFISKSSKHLKLPVFHVLPKLHKKYTFPSIPSRPICGTKPDDLASRISTVLSTILIKVQRNFEPPILPNVYSLLDHINENPTFNNSTDWFFTLDFTSLYTSIPLNDLYQSLLSYPQIDGNTLRLLEILFDNSFFTYNDQIYQQIEGIAMGTSVAPILANLYLYIKLDSILEILSSGRPVHDIRLYHRYIDDATGIFNGTEEQLLNFFNHIKEIIAPLEITYEYSRTEINFLDVTLYSFDDRIHYKTFHKPISKFSYLSPHSNHPAHTFIGFIRGELIRLRRTCSRMEDYRVESLCFNSRLQERGYSKSFIEYCQHFDVECSLKWKEDKDISTKNTSTLVNLPITYVKGQDYRKLNRILSDFNLECKEHNWQIDTRVIYRNAPNFAKLLMRSDLTYTQREFLKKNFFKDP